MTANPIRILDVNSSAIVDSCPGPDASGGCSTGNWTCAGRRITTDTGPTGWLVWIPPDVTRCPLHRPRPSRPFPCWEDLGGPGASPQPRPTGL
jgi:hypothetical protein